jgi:hypothetical protein
MRISFLTGLSVKFLKDSNEILSDIQSGMILKLPKSNLKQDFDIDKLLEHNCPYKHAYGQNSHEDHLFDTYGASPENRVDYLLDYAEQYDNGETASYLDIRASHRIVHKKDVKDGDSDDEKNERPSIFRKKVEQEWEVVDSSKID